MTQLMTPGLIRNMGVVLASDFAPNDISTPVALARLRAGINAAQGRVFLFNVPYGKGSRNYNFTTRDLVSGAGQAFLQVPSNVRIEGAAGAALDMSMLATNGENRYMIRAGGSPGTAYSLTADAVRGVAFADVGSAAVAAMAPRRFEWFRLKSDRVFIAGGTPVAENQGELLQVRHASGGRVTFWSPLRDSYAMADGATLQRVNMVKGLWIEGLTIHGAGQFDDDVPGDRGLHIVWADGIRVRDNHISRCDNGNWFYSCPDGIVSGNRVEFDDADGHVSNQYGLAALNSCQNFYIQENKIVGGKHGVVQSESPTASGVTRDLYIIRNECVAQWNNAIAAHTNAEEVEVSRNLIKASWGGIEAGCRSFKSSYNVIRDLQNANSGTGISISDIGEGVKSVGDEVYGGRFAFRLNTATFPLFSGSTGPKEVEIYDFKASGFSQAGLQFLSDLPTERRGFRLRGIHTTEAGAIPRQADGTTHENTSPVAIRFEGKLADIVVSDCILEGRDGNGAPASCIYADSDVDGMHVSDVKYRNHLAEVLQGANTTTDNVAVMG